MSCGFRVLGAGVGVEVVGIRGGGWVDDVVAVMGNV